MFFSWWYLVVKLLIKSMSQLTVVILVGLVMTSAVSANTFKQYVLKYRDAIELQKVITPLLPEGSRITVDNNTLLVSAPAKVNQRISGLIKRLDKRQELLAISIFRGKYPEKSGAVIATTDTKVNQLQNITTLNGQTIALTEQGLVKIKVMESVYTDKTGSSKTTDATDSTVTTTDAAGVATGAVTTVTNDTSTAASDDKAFAKSHISELVALPTGVYMRVNLVDKKQVKVSAKIVTANLASSIHSSAELIRLSDSLEASLVVPLSEWSLLSDQKSFSHRAVLGSKRKVYSTSTADDAETSIWFKADLVEQ